ncbi:hypothetical protein [Nocardioides luteus]|uniref:hypothetical protein n=1 Tax=Nocardioides luteus TaxID=1844 RepID=UPI001A2F47AE|nr:hypothetical protein [Nocardioides luteus]MBG6095245.1 hypothetical protein [Nocardioides luteus]
MPTILSSLAVSRVAWSTRSFSAEDQVLGTRGRVGLDRVEGLGDDAGLVLRHDALGQARTHQVVLRDTRGEFHLGSRDGLVDEQLGPQPPRGVLGTGLLGDVTSRREHPELQCGLLGLELLESLE